MIGLVLTRSLTSCVYAGYSHLLSMQAYGLQVSGKLDVAENIAEKALSMHGNDRWACTLSHTDTLLNCHCR